MDSLTRAIAPVVDAGIVVAGSSAGDVAVSGNVVVGALQGIRIAVANGSGSRLRPGSVRVEGNRVRLAVVPLDRPLHRIYLGNPERAWIVDNDIALETADRPGRARPRLRRSGSTDCFGRYPRLRRAWAMLQVRGNVVHGCRDGITVWTYTNPVARLRLLDGNMIVGASTPWRITGGATRRDNLPV